MKTKKHNKQHKYNRTLCSVALSSALAAVAVSGVGVLPVVAQASNGAVGVVATAGQTWYVGDTPPSQPANGRHFTDLKTALDRANAGDTVVLTSDVIYTETNTEGLQINKDVKIDGQNHSLSIRASVGKGIGMHADLSLKDLTLKIIAENNNGVIDVGGNSLTIDNVSTKISTQQLNERPTIVGGKSDKPNAHTRITVIGNNTETRFRDIYAGDEKSSTTTPVTIDIQNVHTTVDNGIKLGGKGHSTSGKVTVTTKSQNINVIDGTNSSSNHVTFTDTNIQKPIIIPGVKKLTLSGNNTRLIVQGSTNGSNKIDELEVKDNAEVTLGDTSIDEESQSITVGTLKADPNSTVLLLKDAPLTLDKTEGNVTIKIKDLNKYTDNGKTLGL